VTPAYVHAGGKPTRLHLDGPSLLVTRDGEAPQRLPFGRLARLVLQGPVALGPDVLPALLRRGRSVALLAPDGAALGFCLPLVPRPDDLACLLEQVADRPDWPPARDALAAAAERRAVLDLVRRLGLARPELRRTALDRRLLDLVAQRLGRDPPIDAPGLMARLEALLAAELAQALLDAGLGPRFQDRRLPERDLLTLTCRVLSLELWPVALPLAAYLAMYAASHREPRALARRLVAWFEAGRERRAKLLRRLLGLLQRRLVELAG
jgi:hypothetical protein